MAITYALMQRLEELCESDPERFSVIKKAKVTKINKEGNQVTGVTYEFGGETHSIDGVVVLATGVPVAPAAASVWQEAQPAWANTVAPSGPSGVVAGSVTAGCVMGGATSSWPRS